jgi:guanine deaminase
MLSGGHQIVRGARLLDGDAYRGDLADLLIEGDTIREIGPPGVGAPEGALEVDASDRLILPGLVNAHTHGDATLAKGLGDRWTLELLLNAQPLRRDGVRLEDKALAARLAAAEMALSGCTACYDLFSEFPAPTQEGLEAVGRAYAEVGIRAVVAPLMADRSFWHAIPGLYGAMPEPLQGEIDRIAGAPSEICLANCRAAVRDWSLDRDQVRLALAPTIPHHCADDFFRACRIMATDFGLGIHTHVAESKAQAVVGRRKYGKTLTAHLGDLGIIGPDFTAAHAVWVDDADLRILADAGASIAHNPTSNLRLGVGLARVRAMLELGLSVGIGTDTSTCSDLLNMFEAMRLACYVSRAQSPDPGEWLTAEQVLVMATQGSARGLGMADLIGRLAPGLKADLVFLDLAGLAYVPLNHAARQVVFQETGAGVESVMVGGRFVVRDRQLLTVDLDRLRWDAEAANERLIAANHAGVELVRRLEPIVGAFCVGLAKEPYHVHRYADH